jgi:hypothetical protein
MKLIICILAGVLLAPLISFGQIDSVIIGSIDVDSGATFTNVPVWVTTVDTIETIVWHLCLRSTDESDAQFANVEYFYPLNLWDMRFDTLMQNGREMGIVALAQTDPGPGPYPLFTNNQRWNILTLRILLDPDMPPHQIIVDSLSAIHIGRNGIVFVPGIINTGLVSVDEKTIMPQAIGLFQNYPNPFNAQTTISYTLLRAGPVTLSIYNIMGQMAATLVDGMQSAGEHRMVWDAGDLPSGVYFGRLEMGGKEKFIKTVLLK